MFKKTKTGSARKRSAPRPNLLDAPAGHEVFVKRRYCFAPARRRPVDQLDGGRQLDPEGSREKTEYQIWSKCACSPPPEDRKEREEEGRKEEKAEESFRGERRRRDGHGAKNWATVSKPDKLDLL